MKKTQMFLIIVFSIVVLKYNLSAFTQPLSFESIPHVKSTVLTKYEDTGGDGTVTMVEFQDSMLRLPVDSGYEARALSI